MAEAGRPENGPKMSYRAESGSRKVDVCSRKSDGRSIGSDESGEHSKESIRNWLVVHKTHSRGHYHSVLSLSSSCIRGTIAL